jgi:hypothetical protein
MFFFLMCVAPCIFIYDCNYLHQPTTNAHTTSQQSANRHVPLTTDSVIQDNILNNTTTNSIIHTHIKIHVLTILTIYVYNYIKYFRRILVSWYLVNALMMTS